MGAASVESRWMSLFGQGLRREVGRRTIAAALGGLAERGDLSPQTPAWAAELATATP